MRDDDCRKASKRDYLITFISVLIWFCFVFYGSDFIAKKSLIKYKSFFEWEILIPYIKEAYVFYFGIFFLPMIIPFVIKKRDDLYLLAFRLLFSITIAGFFFLFFPCEIGYAPKGQITSLDEFARVIAGTYNLIPSLHVTLTLIIIKSIYPFVKVLYQKGLILLGGFLILSTLFTHQHHVLDIVAGGLLFLFTNLIECKNLFKKYGK